MNLEVFEFLGKEVPNSMGDIREALDLLATSIDSTIDRVGEKVNVSYNKKEFKKASELITNSEELNSLAMLANFVINYI